MKLFSYRVAPFLLALALWLGGNVLLGTDQARGDELFGLPADCAAWHTATYTANCNTGSLCILNDTAEAKCVPAFGGSLNCRTVFDPNRPVTVYFSLCPCAPYNPNAPSNLGWTQAKNSLTSGPGQACP